MRHRAFRGCLIAVLIILSSIASAKEPKEHAPNNHDKGTAQSEKPADSVAPISYQFPFPLLIPQYNQPSSEIYERETAKEDGEKGSWFVEWAKKLFYDLKITDIVIAFASVALAIYTLQLRRSTDQLAKEGKLQRRDARRNSARQAWQTRKSLVIAGTFADAAMISAKVAEQTLMTAETPYIIPTIVEHNIRAIMNGNDTGCVDIDYSFHNYGRTPAIITQFNVECGVIERIFTITGVDDEGHYAIGPDNIYMKSRIDMCETIFKDCKSRTFKYHLDRDGEQAIFRGKLDIDKYCPVFRGNVIFSDIFGVNYIQTFILAFDYASRQFYSAGGIENNRRRRLDP